MNRERTARHTDGVPPVAVAEPDPQGTLTLREICIRPGLIRRGRRTAIELPDEPGYEVRHAVNHATHDWDLRTARGCASRYTSRSRS